MIPALTPITTRCIPVDIDQCATCTDDEWAALMLAKYGADFDPTDFLTGPDNPTLTEER